MTRRKGKRITVRLEEHLYNTLTGFAKEQGFINVSDVVRYILIMFFMAKMVGAFNNRKINVETEFANKYFPDLLKE